MRLTKVARSLLVAVSPPVLPTLGGKGSMGVSTPDVLQSSASSSSSSVVFQIGMFFKFFDQWRSITSNRSVLNMVWGNHLQLRSHPPLFCNFQQFSVKVAAAHHPFIQKAEDELLAKGASCLLREQLNHLQMVLVSILAYFVVLKCTGGL